MAFFEKVGETISTKGKEAAQRAKGVADLAKLNAQLGQLEGRMRTWYQVIGEKVYQNEKDQEHTGLEVEFDRLNETFAEIGRVKKQIADIKGLQECPACKAQVDSDALFCPRCGAKLEHEPPEEADGAENVEDMPEAEGADATAEEGCCCTAEEKEDAPAEENSQDAQ